MLKTVYRRVKRALQTPPPPVVSAVRRDALTYLDEAALKDLLHEVTTLEKMGRQGVLIEAGCALGGSAIVIASGKSKARPFYIYDVFGVIPPPGDNDGDDVHERYRVIKEGLATGIRGQTYYGYQDNLLDTVVGNFRKHGVPVEANNVHLVRGLFQDTMHIDQPVALAHIDGDWYESVMTCLQRIVPHLVHGGVLVIDDYDAWSGCRKAVDEYFADKRDEFDFVKRARLNIVKR